MRSENPTPNPAGGQPDFRADFAGHCKRWRGALFAWPDGRVAAAQDAELLAQLAEVNAAWQDFRGHLETVLGQPPSSASFQSALAQIESASPELVNQSDAAVRLLEAEASQKVARLRWIQAAFLACALLLLAGGAWMVGSPCSIH